MEGRVTSNGDGPYPTENLFLVKPIKKKYIYNKANIFICHRQAEGKGAGGEDIGNVFMVQSYYAIPNQNNFLKLPLKFTQIYPLQFSKIFKHSL